MADFTREEIDALYRVMSARRDMRHFLSDPLDPQLLDRLLAAAYLAPSVGLMQPWRFIRVSDRALRERIHALVEAERVKTARALGERESEFMRLKVEGILDCGELLVAALAPGRDKHVFGRRTMPEMDPASVACAIQNLWLARAPRGSAWVGVAVRAGELARAAAHAGGQPAGGVSCLGHVREFYPRPMLEMADWARRCSVSTLVHQDDRRQEPAVEDGKVS